MIRDQFPEKSAALHPSLRTFVNDVDLLGTTLDMESQKRVSESAEALAIRQAGESSIIAGISASVTASMNDVMRWVYWWHSIEQTPEDITTAHISCELNRDFEASLLRVWIWHTAHGGLAAKERTERKENAQGEFATQVEQMECSSSSPCAFSAFLCG